MIIGIAHQLNLRMSSHHLCQGQSLWLHSAAVHVHPDTHSSSCGQITLSNTNASCVVSNPLTQNLMLF